MMIDVHGYGDAPPNFMGGIDALRKSYVFEGNSSEKAFSSPAMNAQMNKLFEHLRVKIEDKALHAMRTVHVELLKKKDVPTDHYKSLWNFTDKEGKDVTDAHYAKSTPDTVVKATADHDPFATKIIIWRRVPIPSSLSSLVFNGAIVRFRDALNDPVKCKELAQYWDADQSKWVYNGLESLKVICDWWEASANCFYYNMAYVRLYSKVYDTKPVKWLFDNLPGLKTAEFEDVCAQVRSRVEHGRREALGKLNEDSTPVGAFKAVFPELMETLKTQLLTEFKKEFKKMMDKSPTISEAGSSPTISETGSSSESNEMEATVSNQLPESVIAPAVEQPESSAMVPSDEPPPIVLEDGPFRLEYSRPFNPDDPFNVNVPICSLRNLGGKNFKSSKEIYDCATKHFRLYNLRHGSLWRSKISNTYSRYQTIVGHVKDKMAAESLDVDAACKALDQDIRFAIYNTSNTNDPNRSVVGYSFNIMGQTKSVERDDFGMGVFEKQQSEIRAAERAAERKRKKTGVAMSLLRRLQTQNTWWSDRPIPLSLSPPTASLLAPSSSNGLYMAFAEGGQCWLVADADGTARPSALHHVEMALSHLIMDPELTDNLCISLFNLLVRSYMES
ncbi:hypothetical protein BDR26DRAFT_946617 [Obelidium mucronatum]|nr:hypothetical protein BDR26DRAFT_946617 [Obelidium mucronatum]